MVNKQFELYNQVRTTLKRVGYLIVEDHFDLDDFFFTIEKEDDESQTFEFYIWIDENIVNASIKLTKLFVNETSYNTDLDDLPEYFEDKQSFELEDSDLVKKLINFVENINYCCVADTIKDILDKIDELADEYSEDSMIFLCNELQAHGYMK